MGTAIRTRIVQIGNSQGIRIPKLLLEQKNRHKANRQDAVDPETQAITPLFNPQQQPWHEHFTWNADAYPGRWIKRYWACYRSCSQDESSATDSGKNVMGKAGRAPPLKCSSTERQK